MTHPLYSANIEEWREYRLSYEGGREYLNRYLVRHQKEPSDYYRDRLARAVHPNQMRAVVDTYAAHLYASAIPRSAQTGGGVLDEFWQDMDLLGNGADEFYERVAQLVQRGGRAFVVVDRLDPDGGMASTKAQERESGRRPYAYVVDTEDVVDWDVDRLGRLVWIMIREAGDVERSWNEPHIGESTMYRVWTRAEWILIEEVEEEGDNGESITRREVRDRGPHPCGEVPVVPVFWGWRQGVEPVADSALKDLAPLNRRLTTFYSLIDEQIHAHVFNIMAVPESTYNQLAKIDFSAVGAIPYGDDVSTPPHYIGPEVQQIEVIRAEIDKTEAAIRMLSGLGRVNEDTKHVQSGIALSYMTMDKDALLAKFAQRMNRLEGKVDQIAGAWMEERVESSRTYPSDFDPADVNDALAQSLKFASLGISGLALIESAILAARSHLGPHIPAERMQAVEEDLRRRLGAPSDFTPSVVSSLRDAT